MHNLFTQHDILGLVASRSDPYDWRRLSRVSRPFFECTLALIWWHVEGAHNLVTLLPGAKVKALDESRWSISICLDDISSDDFELGRFKIYSPYVRSLEVYGPRSDKCEISGQHFLTRYAETDVLLPNLRLLTLTTFSKISPNDWMLWVRSLISPTLTDIHLVDASGKCKELTVSIAAEILSWITKIAPQLRRLSLPIRPDWSYHRQTTPSDSMLSLCKLFKRLPHLEELTSSAVVLEHTVFPAIAHLHRLEKLTIRCVLTPDFFWRRVKSTALPPDPLPALRSLSLCGKDGSGMDVYEVLKALGRPGFENVCSLCLELGERLMEDDDPWEYWLVEAITKACPMLIDLSIDFDKEDQHETCWLSNYSDTESALMAMSKLPLETLYLQSVTFSSVTSQDLVTAWPLVTRLSMPMVGTTWTTLYMLAQLPNLQELTLCFHPIDPKQTLDMKQFLWRPRGSLSLHTLRAPALLIRESKFDDLARVVLHCWPNLKQVLLDDQEPKEYHLKLVSCFEKANNRLQSLQNSESDKRTNKSSFKLEYG